MSDIRMMVFMGCFTTNNIALVARISSSYDSGFSNGKAIVKNKTEPYKKWDN
jgi:hypothetical protein